MAAIYKQNKVKELFFMSESQAKKALFRAFQQLKANTKKRCIDTDTAGELLLAFQQGLIPQEAIERLYRNRPLSIRKVI